MFYRKIPRMLLVTYNWKVNVLLDKIQIFFCTFLSSDYLNIQKNDEANPWFAHKMRLYFLKPRLNYDDCWQKVYTYIVIMGKNMNANYLF